MRQLASPVFPPREWSLQQLKGLLRISITEVVEHEQLHVVTTAQQLRLLPA
jgi:hypothetical protein